MEVVAKSVWGSRGSFVPHESIGGKKKIGRSFAYPEALSIRFLRSSSPRTSTITAKIAFASLGIIFGEKEKEKKRRILPSSSLPSSSSSSLASPPPPEHAAMDAIGKVNWIPPQSMIRRQHRVLDCGGVPSHRQHREVVARTRRSRQDAR